MVYFEINLAEGWIKFQKNNVAAKVRSLNINLIPGKGKKK